MYYMGFFFLFHISVSEYMVRNINQPYLISLSMKKVRYTQLYPEFFIHQLELLLETPSTPRSEQRIEVSP